MSSVTKWRKASCHCGYLLKNGIMILVRSRCCLPHHLNFLRRHLLHPNLDLQLKYRLSYLLSRQWQRAQIDARHRHYLKLIRRRLLGWLVGLPVLKMVFVIIRLFVGGGWGEWKRRRGGWVVMWGEISFIKARGRGKSGSWLGRGQWSAFDASVGVWWDLL